MPSRIIREGVTTSEPLSAVSFEAECLFFRLLVVADDFGAFDGRTVIVRAKTMPLRDVSVAQTESWLRELAEQGLVVRYEVGGKPFLAIPKFKQRTRAGSAKYPLPDDWQTSDGQLTGNGPSSARLGVVGGGGAFVVEGVSDGAEPSAQPPAIWLPLIGGDEAPITEEQVREFTDLYRAVDVLAELRKMRGWLLANPSNRKTPGGIARFVTRWLGQEQDKAGKAGRAPAAPSNPQHNPGGISPRLSREEEKRREAEALAEMRRQHPEMFPNAPQ